MGSLFNARKIWPRYGEDWSVAEDRRLRKLYKKMSRRVRHGQKFNVAESIGNILGRTPCGVSSRLSTLKAVDAHLKAARRR